MSGLRSGLPTGFSQFSSSVVSPVTGSTLRCVSYITFHEAPSAEPHFEFLARL